MECLRQRCWKEAHGIVKVFNPHQELTGRFHVLSTDEKRFPGNFGGLVFILISTADSQKVNAYVSGRKLSCYMSRENWKLPEMFSMKFVSFKVKNVTSFNSSAADNENPPQEIYSLYEGHVWQFDIPETFPWILSFILYIMIIEIKLSFMPLIKDKGAYLGKVPVY